MTTDFQPTVPVQRNSDLRTKLRERQDDDWAELKRRLRPAGLDQQGRFPTRDTLKFSDSDIDHFDDEGRAVGIMIVIVGALACVGLIALLSL